MGNNYFQAKFEKVSGGGSNREWGRYTEDKIFLTPGLVLGHPLRLYPRQRSRPPLLCVSARTMFPCCPSTSPDSFPCRFIANSSACA
jgi:hypothetical protein